VSAVTAVLTEVAMVRWPSDDAQRLELRRRHQPTLLVVDEGMTPPLDTGLLEDWVHEHADSIEVYARTTALALRAQSWNVEAPHVDEFGVLRFQGRWLALAPIDARLVRVLTEHFDGVVDRATLEVAGWCDNPPSPNALRVHLLRLRRTLDPFGLLIRNVRGHGYALVAATPVGLARLR
jgi:DNA-binding response OmpR family regulator